MKIIMNLEGKLVGNRYEMVEKIGSGGMSTVYKATDKVLKRNVAVKILRDEFTTDEEFIKRFEAEAQSAARLTHPNIVSIYDVGVDRKLILHCNGINSRKNTKRNYYRGKRTTTLEMVC